MIIAIDGPAGAGKSTVARGVARELGLPFLDTGAMYRAVTLVVLARGIDPAGGEGCGRVARELALSFDAAGHVLIDGEAGEPAIRGREVTAAVSTVSAHPGVRRAIVAQQRALAAAGPGLVAEGRDTTTVVFPAAEHKFFLIATPRERARRRALEQGELGVPGRAEAIQAEIERRDALDSSRADSPLVQAPDAVVVDTTGLDAAAVIRRLLAVVRATRT
jgi:cytidylate kinase